MCIFMKFVSTVLLSLSVLMLLFLCGCLGTEGWNAQDWIDQGSRFAKDELYVEAVDAYSHSIRLDPINPKVWTFRGIALQHLGRQQEAMNDFDEAIRLNPDESGAWQGKLLLMLKMVSISLLSRQQNVHWNWPVLKIKKKIHGCYLDLRITALNSMKKPCKCLTRPLR